MQSAVTKDPSPLLAAVLENTDGPMFSLDLAFRYTGFNRAHAASMKRLYGADIQIDHPLSEYITVEADWRFAREKLQEAFQGKKFLASACLGQTEAAKRYLAFFFAPVRDHTGAISGVVVFVHVIDGSPQQTDAALQTLQLSVENAAASIMITDVEGRIEYVNANFTRLTGYSQQECLGKNPRFLKDPARPASDYRELWETITSGRPWKGIFKNVKKDGSYYWESAAISPVVDEFGQIVRFVAVKEDVTEKQRAEAALRESEQKYRQLARKIPLALCFVDNRERIVFLNDRFVELFSYDGSELHSYSDWWRLAFPDDKYRRWGIKTWSEAVMAAVLKQRDIEPREYKITCKGGDSRTVLISGVIVTDGILATFVDITERKRQERLLQAAFERKKKSALLNELITTPLPSRQTLTACARMLGMRATEPFSCFLVMLDRYQGQPCEAWADFHDEYQRLTDQIVDELAGEACITWASNEGVGILCFDETETASAVELKAAQRRQAETFLQTIAALLPEVDIVVGIAEQARTLTEVGSRFRQAVIAARSGRKMWQQRKAHHYLDIGVFQLLPYIGDQAQIDAYIDRTLGALLQYEKKKKTEFMQTLEMILTSDNLKAAADSLSIHYKTLMFRKQRLEEILGVSLDEFATRMAVATAVNLLKLRSDKDY